MSFKNLLDFYYWFRQPYIAYGRTLWLLVGGFLFLIVAGLIGRIVMQYVKGTAAKTILRRSGSLGITMGFLGLVWMFFRQERVSFLAWRFWLLAWVAVFVWWAARIIMFACRRAPALNAEQTKQRQLEKYLPKGK